MSSHTSKASEELDMSSSTNVGDRDVSDASPSETLYYRGQSRRYPKKSRAECSQRSDRPQNDSKVPRQLFFNIQDAYEKWLPSRRRMHRVTPQLKMKGRRGGGEPSVYEPIMVSLGPYHHGKEELRQAQEFKLMCLYWCTGKNDELKVHFYNLIYKTIEQIRDCYAQDPVLELYRSDELASMMLLDACFIINFLRIRVSIEIAKDSYDCLGVASAVHFTARDIMVLENQIPFFVLKLLITEMYGVEAGQFFLEEFLSAFMCLEIRRAKIPREHSDPPIHILEACRRILVEKYPNTELEHQENHHKEQQYEVEEGDEKQQQRQEQYEQQEKHEPVKENESEDNNGCIVTIFRGDSISERTCYTSREKTYRIHASNDKKTSYRATCPSVTYLKAKGIRFLPSSSHCLKDIKFHSKALYWQLQIPVCLVSDITLVFLSNMIAYEVSPGNVNVPPDLSVSSYTNFMKSLIQTPTDVMELQRKGILRISWFANQEEVVQLFKSIETFNLHSVSIYEDVTQRIGEHCNNKAKTWMTDLVHSKLNSPWTIIALLSAILLLLLTFMQTIYTIRYAH